MCLDIIGSCKLRTDSLTSHTKVLFRRGRPAVIQSLHGNKLTVKLLSTPSSISAIQSGSIIQVFFTVVKITTDNDSVKWA